MGKLVLVATEKNRLLAIDEQQQVVWQSVLGYGPLAGVPYLSGDEIFLSARSGMVWRISAADGKELGNVDTTTGLAADTGMIWLLPLLLLRRSTGTWIPGPSWMSG